VLKSLSTSLDVCMYVLGLSLVKNPSLGQIYEQYNTHEMLLVRQKVQSNNLRITVVVIDVICY